MRFIKVAFFLVVSCFFVATSTEVMARKAGETSAQKQISEGAAPLKEAYKDWQVLCQKSSNGLQCAAVQEVQNKTHQRLLSIQLSPNNRSQVVGVVMAPLGVALTKGLALQSDGKVLSGPVGFTGCVSNGCIAPVVLSSTQLSSLQKSTKLTVKVASLTGQNILLPFSSNGLSEAIARLNSLKKQN